MSTLNNEKGCKFYFLSVMLHPSLDTGLVYRNEVIAFIKEIAEVGPQYGCVLDGRLKIIA